jgi:hypothetical protein
VSVVPFRVLAAALVVVLGLTACTGGGAAKPDSPYGIAPAPREGVTLHPDVVLVGGGGRSVRSVTDGGLTWRIDPNARNADQLVPGKVMFLTSRGVGRVIDARRDGDDLAVTIGPVSLTEVISDGTFSADQPVSLQEAAAHDIPDPFWSQPDTSPATTKPAATFVVPAGLRAGGMSVEGVCCSDGVGARFTYAGSGLRMTGAVTFVMRQPSARFHLEISGTTIERAELEIRGAAGLRVQVDAATETGANVHPVVFVPVNWSVPIGQILGIPFSVTVKQAIGIRTGFSAAKSTIKANGEYSLGGTFGFGYANGRFGPRWPGGLQETNSLVKSIDGLSVGANALIIDYDAKFYIGLDALVFTAGLYAKLTATVGLTKGSSIGFGGLSGLAAGEGCRRVDVTINGSYGIGYTVPALVVEVINFFLRIFNADPIAAEGGIPKRPPIANLITHHQITPNLPVCG